MWKETGKVWPTLGKESSQLKLTLSGLRRWIYSISEQIHYYKYVQIIQGKYANNDWTNMDSKQEKWNYKKNQTEILELKSTINGMTNSLHELKRRFEMVNKSMNVNRNYPI